MKKSIVLLVLVCLSSLCSVAAIVVGIIAYLAVTGLDLLVTAKKSTPPIAIGLAIAALALWIVSLIVYLRVKHKKQ